MVSDVRPQLEALAQSLVQRSGLRELSFRQLADQTGIKSSSVHYYFPEKNDLTAALITSYSQAFAASLQAIDEAEPTLRRKLSAFVGLFEAASADNKLCLCGMLAAELSSLNGECCTLLQGFFEDAVAWLTGQFKQHRAELVITPARLQAGCCRDVRPGGRALAGPGAWVAQPPAGAGPVDRQFRSGSAHSLSARRDQATCKRAPTAAPVVRRRPMRLRAA